MMKDEWMINVNISSADLAIHSTVNYSDGIVSQSSNTVLRKWLYYNAITFGLRTSPYIIMNLSVKNPLHILKPWFFKLRVSKGSPPPPTPRKVDEFSRIV
jgi:hypothetical protein